MDEDMAQKYGIKIEYAKYALRHLKTGYPETYNQYEQLNNAKKEVCNIQQEIFNKMIQTISFDAYNIDEKEIIKKLNNIILDLVDENNVSENIMRLSKMLSRARARNIELSA